MTRSYKDLDVYKRSYKLAVLIHKFSLTLPKELQYDLSDQIRRASRSIPSNLAEGLGRKSTNKDKANFIRIALGSNDEVLFNLKFIRDTNLISDSDFSFYSKEYTICGKQLYRLLQSLDKPAN